MERWLNFSKKVSTGQTIPQDTLGFYLQRVTRYLCMWSNSDDFKEDSLLTKSLHVLIVFTICLHYILAAIELGMTTVTMDNLAEFCNSLSIVIGGCICCLRFIINWKNRDQLTTLLRRINVKVQSAKRNAKMDLVRTLIRQYLLMSWQVITFSIVAPIYYFFMLLLYPLYTGEPYIKLALPGEAPTYSFMWWLQVWATELTLIYSFPFFIFMEGIYLDSAIQIAFLYRVQYDQLEDLEEGREDVSKQLVSISKELQKLKE